MSRIGKKPIELPSGVNLQIDGQTAVVTGPKGSLRVPLPKGIHLERQDGKLLTRQAENEDPAMYGLTRSLVANAVQGVSKGFEKNLDIVGIGYRAEVKEKELLVTLGYSHVVRYPIPGGIAVAVDKQTHLVVSGADKQQVGQVAAEIRGLRPPDPYKNKGVRYTGERLKKKVGKAAATGAK